MGPLSLIFVGRHTLECPAMPCNSRVYIDNSCNSRVPVWKKTHNLHGNANRMILLFPSSRVMRFFGNPSQGSSYYQLKQCTKNKGNPSKLPYICLFWSPKNLCNSMTPLASCNLKITTSINLIPSTIHHAKNHALSKTWSLVSKSNSKCVIFFNSQ